MEQPAGRIWVGSFGESVCVRVEGRATHLHARPLREFARQMDERGYVRFEFDLGACSYMDSTFLGVLAGISLMLKKAGRPSPSINRINARNLELFQTLGVDQFFEINLSTPLAGQLMPLEAGPMSKEEWAGAVIESHQVLCEANQRNEPRFRELLEAMKEDLSRQQQLSESRGEGNRTWKH